jgi:hypothetical protein
MMSNSSVTHQHFNFTYLVVGPIDCWLSNTYFYINLVISYHLLIFRFIFNHIYSYFLPLLFILAYNYPHEAGIAQSV